MIDPDLQRRAAHCVTHTACDCYQARSEALDALLSELGVTAPLEAVRELSRLKAAAEERTPPAAPREQAEELALRYGLLAVRSYRQKHGRDLIVKDDGQPREGWGWEALAHLRLRLEGLDALLATLGVQTPEEALARVEAMRKALEMIEHHDGWTLSPPCAELLAKALKGGV
jgi:hypothetical protein